MTARARAVPGLTKPRPAKLPTLAERTLGNGLRVVAVRRGGVPMVHLRLRVPFAGRKPDHLPKRLVLEATMTHGTSAHSRTEVAVPVMESAEGPRALPAIGIRADGGIYDYTARYTAGSTEFDVPAELGEDMAAEVARVAIEVHRTLGLRDLSRSDLIIDDAGTVWFLEVNVAPGFTETSTVPLSIGADGLDLGEVCRALVDAAVARSAAATR